MISNRLKEIAKYLKSAKILADVGCDHGYLIIEGFLNYSLEYAYAIDNKEGPLNNAIKNIKEYDFKNKVEFLLSDGLEKLTQEVDTVVFAGMGGLLINNLLKKDFKKLKNARIIIQANRNSKEVREFLTSKQYEIVNESIIYEDNFFYEIIIFEKTNKILSYFEDELLYGPILLKNKDNLLKEKLLFELSLYEHITKKPQKIIKKIKKIKELLW